MSLLILIIFNQYINLIAYIIIRLIFSCRKKPAEPKFGFFLPNQRPRYGMSVY